MNAIKFEIHEHPTDNTMLEFYLAGRDKKYLVLTIHADQFDGNGELSLGSGDLPAIGYFVLSTEHEFQCPRCDLDMTEDY